MFAGVIEIEDSHRERCVFLNEVFQTRSTIGQRNLSLGFVPADLRRLPWPVQTEFIQVIEAGLVTYLMRLLRRLLFKLRTGIEHHRHGRHPSVGGSASKCLLGHSRVVDSQISTAFAIRITLPIPVFPRTESLSAG